MKTWLWIAFVITVLAQWAAPLSQIYKHEQIMNKGALVRFRCDAPDPYDMLRGRYLAVAVQPRKVVVDKSLKIADGMPLYLELSQDNQGLATIAKTWLEPPTTGLFIQVHASWVYDGKVSITWPFDRFYLNEKLAPKADDWYRKAVRTDLPVIAEVRVLNGRAVLVDLTQGEKSFRDLLKQQP